MQADKLSKVDVLETIQIVIIIAKYLKLKKSLNTENLSALWSQLFIHKLATTEHSNFYINEWFASSKSKEIL